MMVKVENYLYLFRIKLTITLHKKYIVEGFERFTRAYILSVYFLGGEENRLLLIFFKVGLYNG
jgi:hypothetical protein